MIKKLTTSALSLLLIATIGLFQQTNAQSPVDFGIKGGLNFANLAGSDDDLDSRTGIHAGLVIDFTLPLLPIGIESGIYYSQKGAEVSFEGITATGKLDYIEVPVMAKISVGPPGPFAPHIIAGPYAAYNVKSELDDPMESTDMSDATTDIDFGGVIGLGADLNLGLTKVNVQARYSRGFVDINDNGFDEDGEYNSVFSISAGIMF